MSGILKAIKNFLTSLWNKRYIDNRTEIEIERDRRNSD